MSLKNAKTAEKSNHSTNFHSLALREQVARILANLAPTNTQQSADD
tara:strand:+ start:353 stop:490 length:138 start_codon:yes stop_codon:yes gene_type:complete